MIDTVIFLILRVLAFAILAIGLGIAWAMMTGCSVLPRLPSPSAVLPPSAGPAALSSLAVWGTWAGGLTILAGVACMVWVARRTGILLIVNGFGAILACQLLAWFGRHAALLSIVGVALLVLLLILRMRSDPRFLARVEKATGIDINRNGTVGN